MCKHKDYFDIIEFGIEDLHHTYENGECSRGYLSGNIEIMAEFHCLECDYRIRFNKMNPRFKYLKNALSKISPGGEGGAN